MPLLKRVPVREQKPEDRAKNFDEVCYGYNQEEAQQEAQRCLGCKKAKCVVSDYQPVFCPSGHLRTGLPPGKPM